MAPELNKELLQAIKEAPLLSSSASQLLQVTSNADYEMGEVIDIVRCDSILTARLLRIVNSAAYNLVAQVTSIDRAVSFLGTAVVVSIAISDSASEVFEDKLEGYDTERGTLWHHELFSGIAAKAIAKHVKPEYKFEADLAFTAGILHDIGKAVLSQFLMGTSKSLVEDIASGSREDYLEGERGLMGLDHTQVGYKLATLWGLPPSLQEAILHHHHPLGATEELRPMVYAVHLGDILSMMGGYGTGSDSMQYHLDQGYSQFFDIDKNDLALILLEVTEEFSKIQAALPNSEGSNP